MREGRNGKYVVILLTVIEYHRQQLTAVWIHENVGKFDSDIIISNCSDLWRITVIMVDAEDSGFDRVSRQRMVHVMVLKLKTILHGDINSTYEAIKHELQSRSAANFLPCGS